MKKLLLTALFAAFSLSAQAQDIPQECKDVIAYSEKMVEAKKDQPGAAEMKESIKGMEAEFREAVKQNGEKAVAAGCAEMLKMFQEMNGAK